MSRVLSLHCLVLNTVISKRYTYTKSSINVAFDFNFTVSRTSVAGRIMPLPPQRYRL